MILLLITLECMGQLSSKDIDVHEENMCPFFLQMRHAAAEGSLLVPLQKGKYLFCKGCLSWNVGASLDVLGAEEWDGVGNNEREWKGVFLICLRQ
jgi:hypothetical protein